MNKRRVVAVESPAQENPAVVLSTIIGSFTIEDILALGKAVKVRFKKFNEVFWVCGLLQGPVAKDFDVKSSPDTWEFCLTEDGTYILTVDKLAIQ